MLFDPYESIAMFLSGMSSDGTRKGPGSILSHALTIDHLFLNWQFLP